MQLALIQGLNHLNISKVVSNFIHKKATRLKVSWSFHIYIYIFFKEKLDI